MWQEDPAIMFFQVAKEQLLDFCVIRLKGGKVEETFNEIRDIIGDASKSLANVTEANRKNHREIYYLIEETISHRKLVRSFEKGVKKGQPIYGILKSLLGAVTS